MPKSGFNDHSKVFTGHLVVKDWDRTLLVFVIVAGFSWVLLVRRWTPMGRMGPMGLMGQKQHDLRHTVP